VPSLAYMTTLLWAMALLAGSSAVKAQMANPFVFANILAAPTPQTPILVDCTQNAVFVNDFRVIAMDIPVTHANSFRRLIYVMESPSFVVELSQRQDSQSLNHFLRLRQESVQDSRGTLLPSAGYVVERRLSTSLASLGLR
jgi:hypothetical protein